jgi:hypothetical protein
LNSAIRVRFKEGHRQVGVAFLRRANSALSNYDAARAQTLDYLNGLQPLNPKILSYYVAVSAWEHVVLDMQICMDLFRWINLRIGAFEKNDGSKEQRLYTIGNQVKHLASCVDSEQCDREALPLWITAAGLHSFKVNATYEETAEVLSAICTLADELQDPLSFARPQNKKGQP